MHIDMNSENCSSGVLHRIEMLRIHKSIAICNATHDPRWTVM